MRGHLPIVLFALLAPTVIAHHAYAQGGPTSVSLLQRVNIFDGDLRVPASRSKESLYAPIGVIAGDISRGWGTAMLISPCHVITAQHIVDASSGQQLFFYFGQGDADSFEGKIALTRLDPNNEQPPYTLPGSADNFDVTVYRLSSCLDDRAYYVLNPLPLSKAVNGFSFVSAGQPSLVYDPDDRTKLIFKAYHEVWKEEHVLVIGAAEPDGDWATFASLTLGGSGGGLLFQDPKTGKIQIAGIASGASIDRDIEQLPTSDPDLANYFVPTTRFYSLIMKEVNDDLRLMGQDPLPLVGG